MRLVPNPLPTGHTTRVPQQTNGENMIARGEALRVPDLDPGSPEWLATVSGSQVASIIGVNPYQSG